MKTPFKPLDLVERIEPNPDGTHDDLPEPDFDDDDFDDDNIEPDYWQCNSCGKIHGKKPLGGMCERCDAYVEEGYY